MLLGAAAAGERVPPAASTGAETAQLTLALLAPLLESQSRVDAGLIPGTINALLNFLQALTPTALKDTPRTCIVGLERVLQKWLVLDPEKLSESGARVADIASALTAFMLARYRLTVPSAISAAISARLCSFTTHDLTAVSRPHPPQKLSARVHLYHLYALEACRAGMCASHRALPSKLRPDAAAAFSRQAAEWDAVAFHISPRMQ
jgi:hypothetical protein